MIVLVATLLMASPAFAVVFEAEAGFLTPAELEGAGFDLEVGGFVYDD